MAYDFESLFASTKNALGGPTKSVVTFFEGVERQPLKELDVGCGQGRDALFIARLGHEVVGVDISPSGVAQLNADARSEGLSAFGTVADITTFNTQETFDVVLFDRTLHMLRSEERIDALCRFAALVNPGGWLLIEDERSNI